MRNLDLAIFTAKPSHMRVKTADLKNNLSRYLRDLQRSGESITVCDRETPVAILSPWPTDEDAAWKRECAERCALVAQSGLVLHPPAKRPLKPVLLPPLTAGDGRTDLRSIDSIRRRDY